MYRASWLKKYGLVTSKDMHPDYRELHLHYGYRPIPSSYCYCIKSVVYPTNEAFNFWTHFLALIILFNRFLTIMDKFQGSIYDIIYVPVLIYACGTCLMLVGSCAAHMFCSASHAIREGCWFCDYGSITLSSLGSAILYNNYVCPYDCIGISIPKAMPFLGFAGVAGHMACCYSRTTTSKWRYLLRSSVFIILYVGSSIPCAIKYLAITAYDVTDTESLFTEDVRCHLDTDPHNNAAYFLLVTVFCALTVFFNVSKIPERWFPGIVPVLSKCLVIYPSFTLLGTFDIIGHSHQWMHICIAIAFYFQTFIVEDVIKRVEEYKRDGSVSDAELHLSYQNTVGVMIFVGCACIATSVMFTKDAKLLKKMH